MYYSKFQKTIALCLGVLVTIGLFGYLVFAVWIEPSQSPPEGNVSAPLNTGSIAQTKEGDLTVKTTFNSDDIRLGNWGGAVTAAGNLDIKDSAQNLKIQLDGSTGNMSIAGTSYLKSAVINSSSGFALDVPYSAKFSYTGGGVAIGGESVASGYKLDVSGDAKFQNNVKVGNFTITPISGTELGVYDSGGNQILIFDEGS
jgi:hypothetical protein